MHAAVLYTKGLKVSDQNVPATGSLLRNSTESKHQSYLTKTKCILSEFQLITLMTRLQIKILDRERERLLLIFVDVLRLVSLFACIHVC